MKQIERENNYNNDDDNGEIGDWNLERMRNRLKRGMDLIFADRVRRQKKTRQGGEWRMLCCVWFWFWILQSRTILNQSSHLILPISCPSTVFYLTRIASPNRVNPFYFYRLFITPNGTGMYHETKLMMMSSYIMYGTVMHHQQKMTSYVMQV